MGFPPVSVSSDGRLTRSPQPGSTCRHWIRAGEGTPRRKRCEDAKRQG
ncbi:hypothetical protein A7982_12179 [Minicystis rosea]|nr:hypothetical protein A7982_12179 [Minicystis rosea]